jgi:hypothetical protein
VPLDKARLQGTIRQLTFEAAQLSEQAPRALLPAEGEGQADVWCAAVCAACDGRCACAGGRGLGVTAHLGRPWAAQEEFLCRCRSLKVLPWWLSRSSGVAAAAARQPLLQPSWDSSLQ